MKPDVLQNMRPGDFPIGSAESRAAARAMLRRSTRAMCTVIMTGFPDLFLGEKPIVIAPDSVRYHRAADGSTVQVVLREYEPNKYTAFIHQTWKDGAIYNGTCRVESLSDVEQLPRTTQSDHGN